MGLFSRSKPAPGGVAGAPGASVRAGARRPASEEPKVPLPELGFPEGDLSSIGGQLFAACGMTIITFSKLPLAEHFAAVSHVAPSFAQSSADPVGAGNFRGRESTGAWIAWDSPRGSVIATHCFPDGDSMFVVQEITDKVATARDGVEWNIATSGRVPQSVAAVLSSGQAVPVWELPGLHGLRPPEVEGAKPPELLRQRLVSAGWEQLNETLFKAVFTIGDDRSQVVFFGTYNASSFACMSPVAHSEAGRLPEQLRAVRLDRYRLDVVADLVMLCEPMPAGPPSPSVDAINQAAVDLGAFADRIEADLSTDDTF